MQSIGDEKTLERFIDENHKELENLSEDISIVMGVFGDRRCIDGCVYNTSWGDNLECGE